MDDFTCELALNVKHSYLSRCALNREKKKDLILLYIRGGLRYRCSYHRLEFYRGDVNDYETAFRIQNR